MLAESERRLGEVEVGKFMTTVSLLLGAQELHLDRVNTSVGVHQAQAYQQKNMDLSFIVNLREEIRDFMTIFVGRMSNNMIMGTLFLGIAASFICEGTIDETAPDFLHHSFYHCIVISFFFFGLAMVFAMKAVSVSYAESRQYLLHMVPDQLSFDDFDYVEKVNSSMKKWRLPVFARFFQKGTDLPLDELSTKKTPRPPPGENKFKATGEFNKLWEPSADASNECMGNGICALCQGFALFALGHEYDRSHWGAVNLYVTLSVAGVLVANRMLTIKFESEKEPPKRSFRVCIRLFTVAVPLMFLLGDLSSSEEVVFCSFLMMALLHSLLTWMVLPAESKETPQQSYEVKDLEAQETLGPMLHDLLAQSRENARESMKDTKRVHATGHIVAAFAWFSLSLWIAARAVGSFHFNQRIDPSAVEQLSINWPNGLVAFHAQALSCSGDGKHLWIANRRGIYKVSGGVSGGNLEPVQCSPVSGHLLDMTAACDAETGRCSNLALTSNNDLINCETQERYPWYQRLVNITSISAGGMEDLWYFDGIDIIHNKSKLEIPVDGYPLKKFEVLGAKGSLFFAEDGRLELRRSEGEELGRQKDWQLPSVAAETLRGACVLDQGESVVVALQDANSKRPRVLKISLK